MHNSLYNCDFLKIFFA